MGRDEEEIRETGEIWKKKTEVRQEKRRMKKKRITRRQEEMEGWREGNEKWLEERSLNRKGGKLEEKEDGEMNRRKQWSCYLSDGNHGSKSV